MSPDPNPTPGGDGGPPLDPAPPAPQTLTLSGNTTIDLGGVSGPVHYDAATKKLFVPTVQSCGGSSSA